MPIKRRRNKSARLCEYRQEQLLRGPDSCLLAGVGYLESAAAGTFDRMSEAEQCCILSRMRDDWHRHGTELLAAWQGTGESWAQQTFGVPANAG